MANQTWSVKLRRAKWRHVQITQQPNARKWVFLMKDVSQETYVYIQSYFQSTDVSNYVKQGPIKLLHIILHCWLIEHCSSSRFKVFYSYKEVYT